MLCTKEGYVQSANSESLCLEQLKTVFYSLLAIELIGFAIGIVENVVRSVSLSISSEALVKSTPSFEGSNPVLYQKKWSSNFTRILNQANSDSEVVSELKKLIFSEDCDIMEETG